MSRNVSVPRIKLPHQVIVKAPGLLPMLYTVRGLAEELGMPERTLRDWLVRGAPQLFLHRSIGKLANSMKADLWVVVTYDPLPAYLGKPYL